MDFVTNIVILYFVLDLNCIFYDVNIKLNVTIKLQCLWNSQLKDKYFWVW
jgi:hypothetical protein